MATATKKAAAKKAPPPKPASAGTGVKVNIQVLVKDIVEVPIDDVLPYPKNPRIGNLAVIKESIEANGLFMPLFVQKSTNYCLSGNQTLKVLRQLGQDVVPVVYLDVDDKRAAAIVLVANRANDLATYNPDILADVMRIVDSPVGTGYSDDDYKVLTDAIEYHDAVKIDDVIRPELKIVPPTGDNEVATAAIKAPPISAPQTATNIKTKDEDDVMLNDVDAKLQGILQLSEGQDFRGSNYYEIPDLLGGDSLLDKWPTPTDTWAGWEVTPDDGQTHWLWNYGVASKKNLPKDGRVICCFYTHDDYFENWYAEPAFYTTKVLNMGVTTIVVPDFSFYAEFTTAQMIFNTYRAQWLGRFFQEAGMKVVPRLQYSITDGGRSLDYCLSGIPMNPPVLASSQQNIKQREEFKGAVDGLLKALQTLHPRQLVLYGGSKPIERLINAVDPIGKGLCEEVIHLANYAEKRRGIAFDKKEGLAGSQARKSEKKNRERDVTASDEDFEDLEAPEREERPRRKSRMTVPADPPEDDDD